MFHIAALSGVYLSRIDQPHFFADEITLESIALGLDLPGAHHFVSLAYIAIDYNLYIYIFIHLCLRPNIHQYVQLFFLQIIYVGTIEVGPMPQHAISCNHRDGVGYTVYPR